MENGVEEKPKEEVKKKHACKCGKDHDHVEKKLENLAINPTNADEVQQGRNTSPNGKKISKSPAAVVNSANPDETQRGRSSSRSPHRRRSSKSPGTTVNSVNPDETQLVRRTSRSSNGERNSKSPVRRSTSRSKSPKSRSDVRDSSSKKLIRSNSIMKGAVDEARPDTVTRSNS